MRTVFLPALAALALASPPAVAGTIWVNDPALTVDTIDTIVFGAKYRLSPTNFDQSLDSGGGTTLVSGSPNFLSANRGNIAALNGASFDFTLDHRAGEGFIWTLTSPAGAAFTQAWGSFAPPVAADQLAAALPSTGADGNVAGDLVSPGARFNAIHLESRASVRSNISGPSVTYSDLVFSTPGLTQVGSVVTGFALVPGGGNANPNFPDPDTDYHSQWFVSNVDLAGQDWLLSGKITLAAATFTGASGDEFVKFGVSGKWTEFTPPSNPIPEPATWAMLIAGFGLVGGAMRQRRSAIA